MKTSKATRNIRKFINTQNGRPPRVKSLVDDYGNRVHIVKGKVKNSRSLSENKKAARKLVKQTVNNDDRLKQMSRHYDSAERRQKLTSKTNDIAKQKRLYLKKDYHSDRAATENGSLHDRVTAHKNSSRYAASIHSSKRKSKDFTKQENNMTVIFIDQHVDGSETITNLTAQKKEQRQANRKHPIKRVTNDYGDEVLVSLKTGSIKNPHTKEWTLR